MKVCPDCRGAYMHSSAGRKQKRIGGAWGKGKWPAHVYHSGSNRKCERHTAQANADSAHRRATKLNATPAWADRAAIKKLYLEARRITLSTGIKHEVDHEVPLRGANVTGLHIAENLRVISAKANREKSNRF